MFKVPFTVKVINLQVKESG